MSLFETELPRERLHPNFKHFIDQPNFAAVRKVIQSWGKGLLDRKNEQVKFVNEFQTTFNSAFWELYLNEVFATLEMSVDYSKESPDFCVTTKEGYCFNVEAVVANPPLNEEAPSGVGTDEKFLDDCTIKLLGKLKHKLDLFTGIGGKTHPYSSLSHVKGKPFVIAVAPFNSNFAFSQNNIAINRVLFGIDKPESNSSAPIMSSIKKTSGATLDLGIFTNDSFKEISAVIFSTTGMLGKAIVQSGIPCAIKATRYRQIYKYDFLKDEGMSNLGSTHHSISPSHDVYSLRFRDGDFFCGSDMHLCNSDEYTESHVDGLHIYFNPFALEPLNPDTFDDYNITHNFYDLVGGECVMEHHDQSLVSRQILGYE
ncbi:hypothetical protein EEAAV_26325 (plasmid) [Rahnella aceris]